MDVAIGIVGLPNTGKSTLFNALTKQSVPAENFPFCTIDPSVGVVPVPDDRLAGLAGLSRSRNIVPAAVEFVDIAGLVRGASKGEGLGNEFLSHIREVDAIAHVVRCFLDNSVTHVDGDVDPVRDIETIETELLLSDAQVVERRLEKIAKDAKRQSDDAVAEKDLLDRMLVALRQGHPASSLSLDEPERKTARMLGILTVKPLFYVCNIGAHYDERHVSQVKECAARTGSEVVAVSVLTEGELSGMHDQAARSVKKDLASGGGGLDSIIATAYSTLGRVSFFTTGEKETRAWTVPSGATAPRAAGAIHSDFEKNFIRAEVIPCDDLLRVGSYAKARAAGLLRSEGKRYVVLDGDVIIFRTG